MKLRIALVLGLCLCFAIPLCAAPVLSFDETGVTVTVSPNATAALLGMSHEWGAYRMRTVERTSLLEDTDGDGVVRLDLEDADQLIAVWVAVDMATGERTVEAMNGEPLERETLASSAMQPEGTGIVASVTRSDTFFVTWLVRPGVGAWTATVEDGATNDGDALSNGSVSSTLDDMSPVSSSPAAPDDFIAGDIVVVVAPMTLRISDGQVEN